MSETKVPAIPAPTDSNLRDVARAVKGVLDVREGLVGDPLDSNVTFRDLVDGGLVTPVVVGRGGGSSSISVLPAPGLSSGSSTEPDFTPPPAPTGFTVTAGLAVILLGWDSPTYGNHAYTEIWRAETNVIGSAIRIATVQPFLYTDNVGSTGITRYYWIRHVSTADIAGPYNATGGTSATTGKIGNVDLGPLIVEAGNLASGAVSASKLASDAVSAGVFAAGYEPLSIATSVPATKTTSTVFNSTDGKLYRWDGSAYVASVPSLDISGLIAASQIDEKGLDILDLYGNSVFSHTGAVSTSAYVTVGGDNVTLSSVAANALVPSLNYVGTYTTAPTSATLGANWKQNSVYKNSTDGNSYVLTGTPLGWVVYLADGLAFLLTVESTNGTTFRVGSSTNTTLKGRLFKNGAEVTDVTPAGWFRWRRVSAIPQASPNDDTTWNNLYVTGYKQVSINVDDVYARATFFCDIVST